uniref:ABC transmembrane type-2 domain-containing protein n=1 Tax=Alsidium seaforthii TaxID=2007182 RepID=A0A1Z1MDZ9_9FLOR|nr:hypothetical protein [Bryothamnion seaforthii]ARW64011.1 hypothetical protein [Bryothamnion seaforthii]
MNRIKEIKHNLKISKYLTPNKYIYSDLTKYTIVREIKTISRRLFLQTYRRPSSIIISILQPLLWLTLFGALFQNAPINLFNGYNIKYREFLNPGIMIFTAFNSSLNAGLSIIFDREFGFLNRIITSPLIDKNSIIYSCIIHTWAITLLQIIAITIFNTCHSEQIIQLDQLITTIIISTIIIINISVISICNAFILPGHIEFIALTALLINLPTLFASTALAPLSFMPYWLQIIVCINPLTYAIEIIRQSNISGIWLQNNKIINTIWFQIHLRESLAILLLINTLSFILIKKIIKYKYD